MTRPTYQSPTGQQAEGQALTDLQEYNQRLEILTRILKIGIVVAGIIGGGFLVLAVFILVEIMRNNILSNIVRACL